MDSTFEYVKVAKGGQYSTFLVLDAVLVISLYLSRRCTNAVILGMPRLDRHMQRF